ncbi:TPA: hypothetical protein ACGY7R_000102 [Stenotrophomonas maltophilia]
MSILNVLISRDQLVVAVDPLAEDALTGAHSAGAKMLLIPQHNMLLATRGAAQFPEDLRAGPAGQLPCGFLH